MKSKHVTLTFWDGRVFIFSNVTLPINVNNPGIVYLGKSVYTGVRDIIIR